MTVTRRRSWVARMARMVPVALLLACDGSDNGSVEPPASAPKAVIPGLASLSLVPLPAIESGDQAARDGARQQIGTAARGEVVGEVKKPGEPAPASPAPASPAPAFRPVFDLADNRLLAHWYRDGGLHVAAGSPGYARYVQPARRGTGWELGQRQDGVPVAVLRRRAALSVPLDDAAPLAGAIALRLYSRGRARLSLALNGRSLSEAKLERGWQTVSAPVAPEAWRGGENGIRVTVAGTRKLAVSWLRIGGSAAPGAEPAVDPDRLLSFFDPADHSLRLTAREQLVYYLYLPEGAVLAAHVVGEGADAAACRVAVRARAHLAAASGELTADSPRVDLDSLAGQIARVQFALGGCASARLEGAALVVPGAPPERRSGPPPRHVVLWITDSLRADRIRPIRPGAKAEAPAFERLAAEGAVFRQAYVQGSESQTSHASLWTSRFPAGHRGRSAGHGGTRWLSRRFAVLGETAHHAGLYASGVTANGSITRAAGYARGFDSFINMTREGRPGGANPGRRIVDRALATLGGREKEPFFLFVGTIEGAARARGGERGPAPCTGVPTGPDLVRSDAVHDSAVSDEDRQLGQMLDKLDQWGIAGETMVVVTADRGEEAWDEGRCGPGAPLRDGLVHVPLLVRYPPLVPGGTVIEEGVDALDVLPTLSDALGFAPPWQSQGQSLLTLAQGLERGYPRPSYASQDDRAHALRVGAWKISLTGARGLELHDLEADPGERATAASRPVEARFMIDLLRLFLAHRAVWNKREWGVVSNMSAQAAAALGRSAGRGRVERARR